MFEIAIVKDDDEHCTKITIHFNQLQNKTRKIVQPSPNLVSQLFDAKDTSTKNDDKIFSVRSLTFIYGLTFATATVCNTSTMANIAKNLAFNLTARCQQRQHNWNIHFV